ncbi:MAG: hypothetical protein ACK5HT_17735, partial [Draconibacterium sp.]
SLDFNTSLPEPSEKQNGIENKLSEHSENLNPGRNKLSGMSETLPRPKLKASELPAQLFFSRFGLSGTSETQKPIAGSLSGFSDKTNQPGAGFFRSCGKLQKEKNQPFRAYGKSKPEQKQLFRTCGKCEPDSNEGFRRRGKSEIKQNQRFRKCGNLIFKKNKDWIADFQLPEPVIPIVFQSEPYAKLWNYNG